MTHRLFVDGLSPDTTDEMLQRGFGLFGPLTSTEIVRDRDTGDSCGFGFVTFADEQAAANAITWLNGIQLEHTTLKILEADDLPLAGSEASRWSPDRSARL